MGKFYDLGFTKKIEMPYVQKIAQLSNKNEPAVLINRKKIVFTNPETGESKTCLVFASPKDRQNYYSNVAKNNSCSIDKNGNPYVISDRLRSKARGVIEEKKFSSQVFKYKNPSYKRK